MTLVRENSVQQINAALQSIQRELEMLKMSKNNVPTEEIESIQTSMRALGFSVGNVITLSDFCNAIANKYGEGQYTIYFSSSVNDSNVITDGTNNIRLADVYVIGYFCSMMDSWKLSEFTIVTASSRQDVWQGVCRTAENPNEPYSKLFQTFSSATTRVNSVNGKTGTVTLNATDVGALPSSTVIPAAQVNSDWNASSGVAAILNKPSLATVATSGNYNDLSNKPTIPTVPVDSVNGKTGAVVLTATDVGALPDTTHIPNDPVQADWTETDNTKLDYIKNKPTIPTLQDIFDVTHPVGEVYVQFPQQDAPATLYNQNGITSTWVELDYGGKFFRANGGNALTFAEASDTLTVQANQNQYHRHTHSHTHAKGTYRIQGQVGYVQFMSGVTSSGALTTTEQGSPKSAWDGSTSARQLIKLDTSARSGAGWTGASAAPNNSNTSYNGSSTDTEARPDNYTIKIWKRTA